jgi:hypothetical protein
LEGRVEVHSELIVRVLARRCELEEEIFARVRDGVRVPVGVERDAQYLAGLRATVGAAVEHALAGIQACGREVEPPPPQALAQARLAARVGVSLDAVVRRYVIGSASMGDFIVQEADRCEPPVGGPVLREALRAQAAVLDRMIVAVTEEYGRETRRLGRSGEQRRRERVGQLLAGAVEELGETGYALETWHVGAIAVGPGAAEALRGIASARGARLLCVPGGERGLWAWFGLRDRPVAGAREVQDGAIGAISAVSGLTLALGEPARGLAGWRSTHRGAQLAYMVARHRPGGGVTRYRDVALEAAALSDELLERTLHASCLEPLEDERGGGSVRRRALRAVFGAEHNISSAASLLEVDRATVRRWLEDIERRLGHRLHERRAEIELALRLEELRHNSDQDTRERGDVPI